MTEALPAEPIAIIGIGCRYPGASHPAAFWQMIRSGVDGVTEVTARRLGNPSFAADSTQDNLRQGGFLEQIEQFDPQFFGIAPYEATTMDPQQRLLLEVAWEALEDAGQRPDRLRGSKTGVFVGISTHDYSVMLWQQPIDNPYATTGTGNCIAANRISYAFDFKGPSLAIDTACSSSLVAVHLACQSLYSGESSLAIAAGVNILLVPNITAGFTQGGFMSSSGRCRSFDAAADGYVRSEGAGAVVLKPLVQALADCDPVYAIIRGSAVNQDGFGHGIAAPNPKAQAAVLRAAYQQAGVNPAQVQYVEAHGTGTKLGDPIEAQALGEVFSAGRAADDPCAIGSVKSNIGHTEAAAGIAGLIKAALVLKHRELPPSLHCHQPNPAIDFDGLRLQVQTQLAPLTARSHPAYAGVNSFGFGGTNAHIVLEEAPARPTQVSKRESQTQLLTLSAKNQSALKELVQRYRSFLAENLQLSLADVCATANTRRSHFSHRLACVADSAEQLQAQLRGWDAGERPVGTSSGTAPNTGASERQLIWLFTGQGAQFVGMGRELYEQQSIFRQALDRCQALLSAYLEPPLTEVLFTDSDTGLLDQTAYTQPALFALEYALAQLWLAWGIRPTRLLGHSVGEYVAACLAGVFSLEAALELIAARGRLMQALPPDGAMISVRASRLQLQPMIAPYEGKIAIAALNGPESTVISGQADAIVEIQSFLQRQAIQHQRLNVSNAFHSPLMEPMLAEFRQIAERLTYHPPKLPIVSTLTGLTGTIVTADMATADYWVRHVCEPVRFLDAMTTLGEDNLTFLEIGPKPILLGLGRACLIQAEGPWLPSLQPERSDRKIMLQSLAALYAQGFPVDWDAVSGESVIPISLPTYPFQRQRYWWTGAKSKTLALASPRQSRDSELHPLLGHQLPLAGTTEQRFQVLLNSSQPAYLADHQILTQALLPAAAFFEIAIACGMASLTAAGRFEQNGPLKLSQVSIEQPLLLSDSETMLQIVRSPQADGTAQVQIFSQSERAEGFTRHAVGQVSALLAAPPEISLADFQSSFLNPPADPVGYYQNLSEQGFNYGPSFQAIQQLWVGDRRALSRIQLPDTGPDTGPDAGLVRDDYYLHPVLLDACFQSIGATLERTAAESIYLPVGLESLQFYQALSGSAWCGVSLPQPQLVAQKISPAVLKADMTIWDETGAIAVQITGLTLQSISRSSLRRLLGQTTQAQLPQDFYHLTWQAQPQAKAAEGHSKTWLIFADTHISPRLIEQLQARGDRCISVESGKGFAIAAPDRYILNPARPEEFQQLLANIVPTLEAQGQTTCDILHLWSLDTLADGQPDSQLPSCGSLLHLVQAMGKQPALIVRLWLVTQAAQAVELSAPVQVQQAPLWGLARSLRQEQPNLDCTCLDLDSIASQENLEALLNELNAGSDETQIAYRQRDRYVARLSPQAATTDFLPLPETAAYRLGITHYGALDQLTLVPSQRRSPQPDEVEIQVRVAGINFRDVLNALGLLQPVLEEMGFTDAAQVPFGGECAGVIAAVGSGVNGLRVGDSVIAAQALGSLAQFVTVPAAFVIRKPDLLTDAEAATLPTTFLTACYGLMHLARLKKGDRVLIHAAAGGVGQAAVQIAQQQGAEIFATASPGKWEFLRTFGIQQVMNSRTFDFADDILTATDGQGVDVVFNSLNGEAIPQNLRALAPGGRFVEIGKIGIWPAEQIHEHRPDIEYFPFDLLEVSQAQPDLIAALLSQLLAQFQAGTLRPLPKKVFAIEAAPQAFRYMAQARHIGKVVLTLPPVAPQQSLIQAEATYVVTGGLGALGQCVSRWLAEQGAQHLLLIGRRSPGPEAQQWLQQLERAEVNVRVETADIADLPALKAALSDLRYPLKGVFHLAGCLDDGLLTHQTWERFAPVIAPKLTGAWNLHQLTRSRDLDYFVCFSSIASLLGSPGQGNYAAANAFLDALAHHRRSLGLPGLSLNWGPWAAGMAAQLTEQFIAQGLNPIEPERGLEMLSNLMRQPRAQVGIMDIDRATFIPQLAAVDPFLQNLKPIPAQGNSQRQPEIGSENGLRNNSQNSLEKSVEQPARAAAENGHNGRNGQNGQTPSLLKQQLAATSAERRPALLATNIQILLAQVMGFSTPDLIDPAEPFGDLGMDSLMAVELSSQLQTRLDYPVSQALIFDYPTVNALAAYLIEQVTPLVSEPASELTSQQADSQTRPTPSASVNYSSATPLDESLLPEPTPSNGAPVPAASVSELAQPVIPPEYYQFHLMPEYGRLRDQIDQASSRNPFFTLYDGIASNTIQLQGRSLVNYANYNYLGLSGDPRVSAAAQAAIDQYGTSVSASRIVSGERALHRELEQGLANFLGTEDCLLFVGGHATNVTTIGHLFKEKDLILYDALSHNSIREGCQLSGATAIAFPHNDWQALDRLLHQHRRHYQKVLVAVEGIYSADGDLVPLPEIVRIKTAHRAFLLVDEAHSMGVLGSHGRGVGEHFDLPASAVDLWMGTLSKSFASCGGYIAGVAALIEYLKYTSPGFVFSVGMSPANTAAALAALRLLQAEPERVAELQARSRLFLTLAQESGLNTGASQDSPIVPIIVGPTEKAVQLSQTLFQQGINAQPMVYPSVSHHAARVRFFITALHTPEQIRETVQVLKDELGKQGNKTT